MDFPSSPSSNIPRDAELKYPPWCVIENYVNKVYDVHDYRVFDWLKIPHNMFPLLELNNAVKDVILKIWIHQVLAPYSSTHSPE
jgi:hypothetical protein